MKIGLVLSGGAGYGFAHIGVIKILEKYNIVPDIIVGTSVGSLVGGVYSTGVDIKEVEKIGREFKWLKILKLTIPKDGLISIDKLEDFVEEYAKVKKIEDTKIKFAAIATNLLTGKEEIFNKGSLAKAIRASCSLPGIFTPLIYEDGIFVDGGIVNNLPVNIARRMGADFIIAVDATARARVNVLKKHDIFNILWKSLQIMIQENTSYKSYSDADIILMPEIDELSPFDLSNKDRIIKKGEEIAEREILYIMKKIKEYNSIKNKMRRFFKRKR